MNTILLSIICIIALFQPSRDRMIIAAVYAIMCAGHSIACASFVGFWYYFSAAVFDLAIVSIVYAYGARIRLTDDLINISVASIVLNFYGWLTWYNYQQPFSYNLTMVALYFIAIFSLLRKDCADGSRLHQWHGGFRLLIDKGCATCHPKQKESTT